MRLTRISVRIWKFAAVHNFGFKAVFDAAKKGETLTDAEIVAIYNGIKTNNCPEDEKEFFAKMLDDINALEKYGNDCREIDLFARDVAYTYTRVLEQFSNPRGGKL